MSITKNDLNIRISSKFVLALGTILSVWHLIHTKKVNTLEVDGKNQKLMLNK